MRRGSTPTITMTLPEEIPVSGVTAAILTIAQKGKEIIRKELADFTVDATTNTLELPLSQEDTLALDKDIIAEIQLKVKDEAEHVFPSDIIRVPVDRILNEEVI